MGVTTHADRTARARRNLAEERDYRTYAHVVVDEAQDVTPMQWRMLGRRARGATWTVVGDWVQSAWPDVQEVRDALAAVLGKSRLRSVELTTNYRTSTEVAALAARLLERIDPGLQPPAAVRSTGVEPLLLTGDVSGSLEDAVDELLARVGGTVGVVAPYGRVAEVRAVLRSDPRVSVVDPWQVKGLEYDGCVVAWPHGIVAESRHPVAGLRSLYVALTRATQRLVVLSEEPLETLLTD
jgi:DNA helicase IV